jgi:ADP-ribose pyrophosphatase YjhB (NUDIX family)
MKKNQIRPIANCLFRNGNRILVSDGIDPETGSAYCRPLGGSIEFGERAQDAVVREIREELGVEIREVRLLGVLENLFTLDGQQGHEVVFVFDARFVDEPLYQRETLPLHEEGWSHAEARWFDLSKAAQEPARLAPEALTEFLEKLP